jgi:hypothetical protein
MACFTCCLAFSRVSFRGRATFYRGQNRNQVEALEHKPDMSVAPARQFALAERAQALAEHQHFSAGGPVHGRNQVQQRGFARTRGPHEGQKVAALDLQIHPLQGGDSVLIANILLR